MPTDPASNLRFVPAALPEPKGDTLRFDRRRAPRTPAEGEGVAACMPTTQKGGGKVVPIRVLDSSFGGAGLATGVPIEVGTPMTVVLRTPAPRVRSGVVVRCEPATDGFRVGLAFAAARVA